MGTVKAKGCRGMERYREMLEWKDVRYFSVSPRKLQGERELLLINKQKLCIAIYREALKLEEDIGPQEYRLLRRYAGTAGEPGEVVRMIGELAERAYEKGHGHADFSFRVDMEKELLSGKASENGREAFLHFMGELLKGAEREYAFQDWEVRLLLGHACHSGIRKELEGLVREAVLLGGIPQERAKSLAGQAERREMREAGFERMEGMAGYICSRHDLGLGKTEMKGAAFLLHNGALLHRCRDGTRFYRTEPFTVDGSYIIPHFYLPVFEDKSRIGHFEVADEKRERALFERYCGDRNMPKALVGEMRQGRSILKELKEFERRMGIGGAGEKGSREREAERRGDEVIEL